MYFTEWDPSVHVVPRFEIPDEWPRWLAVDYGFAVPFCCLWFAREPETKHIFVYRELYAAGLRDEQQAQGSSRRSGDETADLKILDPSMFNLRTEQQRPSIAAVYWAHGVKPVHPGMNSENRGGRSVGERWLTTRDRRDCTC